jgi:POT family proton-dependent oligopeptide transporter
MLGLLFIGISVLLLAEAARHDKVQVHRVIAMLIIFAFNVLFWMFYFQLGTSFNFLAENLVDRKMFGGWTFPVGWFQSVSPLAILALAPPLTLVWGWLAKRNKEPSIPRKFGLGLIFNGLGFAVLMFALSRLLGPAGLISLVGAAMGGWFLPARRGRQPAWPLASSISGSTGMTAASALGGFTRLLAARRCGCLLLVSPLINRLMHG